MGTTSPHLGVENLMLSVIKGGECPEIYLLRDSELRVEISNLGNSETVFGNRPVDLFEVCSRYNIRLLPYLYGRGMRPKSFEDLYYYPLVEALSEDRVEDASILHDCGYSIFSKGGEAANTFGYAGRFGANDYFCCGDFNRSGDILDALFYNAQFKSLMSALAMASKENLDRRDAAGRCIFKSSYIFMALYMSASAKSNVTK